MTAAACSRACGQRQSLFGVWLAWVRQWCVKCRFTSIASKIRKYHKYLFYLTIFVMSDVGLVCGKLMAVNVFRNGSAHDDALCQHEAKIITLAQVVQPL